MLYGQEERLQKSRELMAEFSRRTGLSGTGTATRRYLWTDAFAVCNFLTLFERSGEERHLVSARTLIDAVHRTLGYFRDDDARKGALSGLDEAEAQKYPTVAGLRIGKPSAEREPDAPYDEQKEWDRDGQYFHYLSKWMHALDQMAKVSGEVRYNRWAVELAKTAHRAFTYRLEDGTERMYWKMSTDLSRPLVSTMGQHDALDAYVTYLQLSVTASRFGDDAGLKEEMESAAAMAEAMPLATDDPLGLGGLLFDAARVAQLIAYASLPLGGLLRALLETAHQGITKYVQGDALRMPAAYRLAFRELGLAIGLHGVSLMQTLNASRMHNNVLTEQLEALQEYQTIAEALELFWLRSEHQREAVWREHEDINEVMLATALLPERLLDIGMQEKE